MNERLMNTVTKYFIRKYLCYEVFLLNTRKNWYLKLDNMEFQKKNTKNPVERRLCAVFLILIVQRNRNSDSLFEAMLLSNPCISSMTLIICYNNMCNY